MARGLQDVYPRLLAVLVLGILFSASRLTGQGVFSVLGVPLAPHCCPTDPGTGSGERYSLFFRSVGLLCWAGSLLMCTGFFSSIGKQGLPFCAV